MTLKIHTRHRHFIVAPVVLCAIVLCAGALHTLSADLSARELQIADAQFSTEQTLYSVREPTRFQMENSTLIALDGAFYAVGQDDVLHIAPLSTPVLYTSESHTMLIPVGRQWKVGDESTKPLPERFFREKLSEAGLQQDFSEEYIDQHDLLALMHQDADLWLVAALHPSASAAAWTLMDVPDDSAIRLQVLSSMPEALLSARAPGSLALQKWALFAERELFDLSEEEQMVWTERAGEIAHALKSAGFPKRASLLSELYAQVTGEKLFTIAVRPVHVFEAKETEESEEAKDLVSVSESDVVSVRQLLENIGALFTKDTVLFASKSGVRVEEVVFSGASDDRVLSFTVHPHTDVVSAISQNGTKLPHSVDWDRFIEWVSE